MIGVFLSIVYFGEHIGVCTFIVILQVQGCWFPGGAPFSEGYTASDGLPSNTDRAWIFRARQTLVFRELVSVRYKEAKEKEIPWFRTLQWAWFCVAMFFS